MSMPRHEALESALDDGDDEATWSVYTDFLLEAGVELGPAMLDETLGAALDHALASPAIDYDNHGDFQRLPEDCFLLAWKHGLLERVRLEDYDGRRNDARALETMNDVLAAVLASPAARFLRTLILGEWNCNEAESSYDGVPAILSGAPQRRALRRLDLGNDPYYFEETRFDRDEDPRTRFNWQEVGASLAPLWAELPNLEVFHVAGTGIELGEVVHDRLIELSIDTPTLDARASLATARLPALRALYVTSGWGDERARLEDIMRLVARTPHLERLTLGHCRIGAEVVAALRSCPLSELSTLRLRNCALAPGDVPAIVALRQQLPALRVLDLADNLAFSMENEDDDDPDHRGHVEEARATLERSFERVELDD